MNCTKDYFANYLSALGKGIFTQRVAKIAGDAGQGEKMTHDELLALLNAKSDSDEVHALRAVVELHKPVMSFTGGYDGEENPLYAEQCNDCSSNGFTQEYPCPTIKAIEKELG